MIAQLHLIWIFSKYEGNFTENFNKKVARQKNWEGSQAWKTVSDQRNLSL